MDIQIRYFTKSKKGNTLKLANSISEVLHVEAKDVSNSLTNKCDILFLVNAMYAANIDKEVKAFIENNKDNIGKVVNLNTAASGSSTYKVIKKCCDKNGVAISNKEFHCKGSWIFINKGYPRKEDLLAAQEFVLGVIKDEK